MSEHVARSRLEAVAGGTADAEARAHLEGCGRCAERLAAIERARARYLDAHPPQAFVRAVMTRAAERPSWIRRVREWLTPPSLAVSAAVATAAVLALVWLRSDPGESGIRWKGASFVTVYGKRGEITRELADGDTVAPGDRLAFAYGLSEPRYAVLWGRDPSGSFTCYYPCADTPTLLPAGNGQLPLAIELDDRRGWEELVVIFADRPLADAEAEHALAAGSAPPGAAVHRFRFAKP